MIHLSQFTFVLIMHLSAKLNLEQLAFVYKKQNDFYKELLLRTVSQDKFYFL
ncbi:MAG: hypothetical protein ABUK01_08150 [Leptospirales bacterium]